MPLKGADNLRIACRISLNDSVGQHPAENINPAKDPHSCSPTLAIYLVLGLDDRGREVTGSQLLALIDLNSEGA